ncbi:MAG: SpoIIE family protein phosphatase [Gammaproteobacteria bacterium]|nr:SpoIIE family protein phosphatase [Gammaproteobacteria bacterium]
MKLLIEQGAKGDSGLVSLRSKLRAVSRRMGFKDIKREHMELVCNEMVTNQNKYAEGNGLVQIWEVTHPRPALDLFAFDYGKGIPNLKVAMQDGYTTAGTMGKGLGAIKRLSSESEIYSIPLEQMHDSPWHGTAVWARFYHNGSELSFPHEIGVYSRAYQDNSYNGDRIEARCGKNKTRWLHMDGLGHGREAAEVVDGIGDFLDEETPVDGLIQRLSTQLQGTRGAVAMVCEIDAGNQTFKICGVGDMIAYLIANGEKKAISFSPGVLGHAHRTPETFTLPFSSQALAITASDGLRRSMTLRTLPELWRLHPQLIALVLGQVIGRLNDDRSVFTIRVNPNTRKSHGS